MPSYASGAGGGIPPLHVGPPPVASAPRRGGVAKLFSKNQAGSEGSGGAAAAGDGRGVSTGGGAAAAPWAKGGEALSKEHLLQEVCKRWCTRWWYPGLFLKVGQNKVANVDVSS